MDELKELLVLLMLMNTQKLVTILIPKATLPVPVSHSIASIDFLLHLLNDLSGQAWHVACIKAHYLEDPCSASHRMVEYLAKEVIQINYDRLPNLMGLIGV